MEKPPQAPATVPAQPTAPDKRSPFKTTVDRMFQANVRELTNLLGAQLVAYMGRVQETRAVRLWIDGERTPSDLTRVRLTNALLVARLFVEHGAREVAPTWFQGMNAALDDHAPAEVLRGVNDREALYKTSREVKAAAASFLRG
jgi:hypothetical protein